MITRRALAIGAAALAMPAIARAAGRVRIGYQKIGSLVILQQQRRLETAGMAVEWKEFTAGPPLLEALNAGAVDFGYTGDTPPVLAQAAGADLVYVGAQPIVGRNEAILVQQDSPIRSLADLRGKRIAVTKGSSAHYLLVKATAKAGFTFRDIQPAYLQPSDGGAAFRTGAVDAWAIWDPFFAVAQQDPATRVLITGEGVAPTNTFFLAGRAFATQSPDIVSAVLAAINDAAAWAAANPDALAQTLAQVTGVPLPAQRVAAARGVYAVQPMDDAVIARQQEVADTFADLHLIPSRIGVRAAVWQPAPARRADAR